MPSKGIIVVYSEEDDALKDSVMEHLGVLDTITKLDPITLESLDRLGTVALKNKLKGREALVVLLSAQILSSKFLRHPMVQSLATEDKLVLLSGRQCAWRIVPWLRDCDIWPESGFFSHLVGTELDQSMTELTYDLASRISEEFDQNDYVAEVSGESDETLELTDDIDPIETIKESTPEAVTQVDYPVAPELVPEIAAGPAPEDKVAPSDPEALSADLTSQFDTTCASIFPEGAKLDDDVLGALLELGLILGSTREEEDDIEGARSAYLHAAHKLVELVNRSLTDGQPISPFIREARLSMWRLLKDAEGGISDIESLRNYFEEALTTTSV